MTSKKLTCVLLAFVLVLCQFLRLEADDQPFIQKKADDQLKVGYYAESCSMAEMIVKEEVRKGYMNDSGLAAGLVRMHFHDCFVGGCDGSILIDSTPFNQAEKDAPPNNPSLRGFEIIDNVKARLESVCPGVVSCADIIAFAARDSAEMAQGLGWEVPAGRRDGRVSLAYEVTANIPAPGFNLFQLTQSFAMKGLTQEEMVTLSGAHTIGRSHCSAFNARLMGQDPSLDSSYAAQLRQECRQGSSVVPMDPYSPTIMDTRYYTDLLANRGLFTSDQALMTDGATANLVNQNARDLFYWQNNFAKAMVKMGSTGVLTGEAGEIRTNCRKIN